MTTATLPMRSWLFAPGDSDKKMGKAIASEADIALLDLEDSVVPDRKAEARELVAAAVSGDRFTGEERAGVAGRIAHFQGEPQRRARDVDPSPLEGTREPRWWGDAGT